MLTGSAEKGASTFIRLKRHHDAGLLNVSCPRAATLYEALIAWLFKRMDMDFCALKEFLRPRLAPSIPKTVVVQDPSHPEKRPKRVRKSKSASKSSTPVKKKTGEWAGK
jgi:hypothetical protein